MIGLIQRVSQARVDVADRRVGSIDQGILLLLGVERGDALAQADRLAERALSYRVFEDADGRMNRSLRDIHGGLLIVPQFTLAADTRSGTRPGFSTAAAPETANTLFEAFVANCRARHGGPVETGQFQADMQVSLTNDGPVTFWLRVAPDERG